MIKHSQTPQKILSKEDMDKIHEASMYILENTGVEILHEEALAVLKDNGAEVEGERVYIPRKLVEKALETVPSSFTLHARNPENNVTIGGNNSVLAPSFGASFIIDINNKRRISTYEDYINFTKLSSDSEYLDVLGGVLVEPNDIHKDLRHAKMIYAAGKYSDKCLMGSALGKEKANDCFKIASILFGEDEIIDDKIIVVSIINTLTPLKFDFKMMDALIEHAKYNQATLISSVVMSGTTGPMTIAGGVTLQNVEVLAGIVVSQLINPGAPVVYGSASAITDMRTAAMAIASPESTKFVGATADFGRYYDVPSRISGGVADSNTADSQAAYEKMMSLYSSINYGANFLLQTCGIIDSYMANSYEQFIIDEEIVGMVKNCFEPFAVNEETIAREVIEKIGPGGNYLTEPHTMKHMKDFRDPHLSQRDGYAQDKLSPAVKRANKKWKNILSEFEAPYLDPVIEKRLDKFMEEIK